MRIHCVQHADFEGPAGIAEWARVRGHRMAYSHVHMGESLPGIDSFDMLVLMGGPMSVNDEALFPWLVPEKSLTREAIVGGKVVLGVCLGAQLMASAMGAGVYRAKEKEIGWFPVRRTSERGLGRIFPPTLTALHWHGETFDLPPEALRLAETDVVPNQAFQLSERALGLQFHMEADRDAVEGFVKYAADDIGTGRFQQTPDVIMQCDPYVAAIRPILCNLLDELSGHISGSARNAT